MKRETMKSNNEPISPSAQSAPSSLKVWASVLQTPELLTYFDGIFSALGHQLQVKVFFTTSRANLC